MEKACLKREINKSFEINKSTDLAKRSGLRTAHTCRVLEVIPKNPFIIQAVKPLLFLNPWHPLNRHEQKKLLLTIEFGDKQSSGR